MRTRRANSGWPTRNTPLRGRTRTCCIVLVLSLMPCGLGLGLSREGATRGLPSLEKRGLSRGAANAFQMFHETEHRLAFPFSESLKNLQCTVDGKTLHSRRQEYSTDAVLGGTYLEKTNGHDDGAQHADYRGPFGGTRGESVFPAGSICACTRWRGGMGRLGTAIGIQYY